MSVRFLYTGIRVKNMDESLRFYTEVLGMIVVEPLETVGPTKGKVVTLKSPDTEQLLELNYYEEDSRFGTRYSNGEDLDHLAFEVEDLRGTVDRLRGMGLEVTVEPYSIAGWGEACVKDPNGIWIEFLEK